MRDSISAVQQTLVNQTQPEDFLIAPLQRIQLAMAMPRLLDQMRHLITACEVAAEGYFGTEASLAARMHEFEVPIPALASLLVIGSKGLGVWPETNVRLNLLRQQTEVAAAESISAMALRIRQAEVIWQPVIRVEKYGEVIGQQKFVVYIPGTQTWTPATTSNPLDLTSNIAAMAGAELAASELGVRAALAAAGATKSDRVLLVGHSQGGLVAMNIAKDNRGQKIAGVVTLGAPVGQFKPLPAVPVLSIEHSNDIVPKLGGRSNPLAADWVTAVRELPQAKPDLVEVHDINKYAETARLVDGDESVGLVRIREQITDFVKDEKAVVSWYRLEQTQSFENRATDK